MVKAAPYKNTLVGLAALLATGAMMTILAPPPAYADNDPGGKNPKIQKPPFGDEHPGNAPLPYDENKLGPLPRLPHAPRPIPVDLLSLGPFAPTVTRVPTAQKVVFITMDDGGYQPPAGPRVLREGGVPTASFLISSPAISHPDYFRRMAEAGTTIQAHTQSHRTVKGLSVAEQRAEICGAADKMTPVLNRRPTLFRPPTGAYDATTLRIIKSCGLKANVLWEGSVINGALYISHQRFGPKNPLRPGMILLLHYTPHFNRDYHVLMTAIAKSKGYSVGRLESYLK